MRMMIIAWQQAAKALGKEDDYLISLNRALSIRL